MLVINCKNYKEANGTGLSKLVRTSEKISAKYGTRISIAPPQHLLGVAAGSSIPILAQHVDDAVPGSTTGFMSPEMLKLAGISGSLINHSEHRIGPDQSRRLVARLADLKMTSILCVRNLHELRRYVQMNPDYIAIEPAELIGSGKAVSKERPELIIKAADITRAAKNSTKLLCGAGIVSGQDVSKAQELGSAGVLVASGIVKAASWSKTISEFAAAFK